MKTIMPFPSFTILSSVCVLLLTTSGCKKETTINTQPHTYAGENQFVFLPDNSCELKGVVRDMQNNIENYFWKKVSGPGTYIIEDSTALETTVHHLETGEYKFELIARDAYGLQGTDTVKISVIQPGDTELIFEDQSWNCPMGCYIQIEDVHFITPNSGFVVFIRENDSSPWTLVSNEPSQNYSYEKHENSLIVYSYYPDDELGKVDIKISF